MVLYFAFGVAHHNFQIRVVAVDPHIDQVEGLEVAFVAA